MVESTPFLYQTEEGSVFHVGQDGVESISSVSSWRSEENIVAFVDGDKVDIVPAKVLLNPQIQIILVSSPKGAYQKWTNQTGNNTLFTKIATSLWSRHELYLAGLVLAFFSFNARLIRFFQDVPLSSRHHFQATPEVDLVFRLQSPSMLYCFSLCNRIRRAIGQGQGANHKHRKRAEPYLGGANIVSNRCRCPFPCSFSTSPNRYVTATWKMHLWTCLAMGS